MCFSFFNYVLIFFLINVYLDLSQIALKYLKDTEVNISILIITGDFNIRDSFWDSNFLYHSSYRDTLFEITDFFGLELSKPVDFFSIKYSDNCQDLDSVLDLVFICPDSFEHDHHYIYPNWRLTSDHALITINITIIEEHTQTKR